MPDYLSHRILVYFLEQQWSQFVYELVLEKVKNKILKMNTPWEVSLGCILTGIPLTSCDFGMSPVYFIRSVATEEDNNDFLVLLFQ